MAELEASLARRLPEVMVPAAWMGLESLPLNASGKVDRRALPRPEAHREEEAPVAARNESEEVLSGLWREVLGVPTVGVRDNFFRLGGHSLAAARLGARLNDVLGLEVPLSTLFAAPTVEKLALALEELLVAEPGSAAEERVG